MSEKRKPGRPKKVRTEEEIQREASRLKRKDVALKRNVGLRLPIEINNRVLECVPSLLALWGLSPETNIQQVFSILIATHPDIGISLEKAVQLVAKCNGAPSRATALEKAKLLEIEQFKRADWVAHV